MKEKKTGIRRIVFYAILSIIGFVLVFLMATIGTGIWQKKAHYPPSIEDITARASINLGGLTRDHMGIAMWQADGLGVEPAGNGHSFMSSPGKVTARYYLSSRDYGHIDPKSIGGLRGMEPVIGFRSFQATLREQGFDLSDLTISLPLCTLGDDIEEETWIYKDGIEFRSMTCQGPVLLKLAGEIMISLVYAEMTLTASYVEVQKMSGVTYSLLFSETRPIDQSDPDSEKVRKAVNGFLADVAQSKVRLVIDKMSLSPETFSGKGRIDGQFGEVIQGRLEVLL